MEKKNTILLTVIAIATLLVAVVGATFAYFTASVSTNEGNGGTGTTTVKSKTTATASMDLGSDVSPTDGVLPGYKVVKPITITGGTDTNASDIKTQITLTPNVPAAFGTDINYAIYEVEVTCGTPTETTDATGLQHFMTTSCTDADKTPVKNGTFSGTTVVNHDVIVTPNFNKTYYIVIEYENKDTVQNPSGDNNQAGQTFSVQVGFKEVK